MLTVETIARIRREHAAMAAFSDIANSPNKELAIAEMRRDPKRAAEWDYLEHQAGQLLQARTELHKMQRGLEEQHRERQISDRARWIQEQQKIAAQLHVSRFPNDARDKAAVETLDAEVAQVSAEIFGSAERASQAWHHGQIDGRVLAGLAELARGRLNAKRAGNIAAHRVNHAAPVVRPGAAGVRSSAVDLNVRNLEQKLRASSGKRSSVDIAAQLMSARRSAHSNSRGRR